MAIWHGYILITKPGAFTPQEWIDVLQALRQRLNLASDSPRPERRLQARFNLARTAILIEAVFDRDDLNLGNLHRLPALIHSIVPRFTREQIAESLGSHLVVFGRLQGSWLTSGAATRQYIAQNLPLWESDDEAANS